MYYRSIEERCEIMIPMSTSVRPYIMVRGLILWLLVLAILATLSILTFKFSWPSWLFYIYGSITILWLIGFVILKPIIYSKVTSYQLFDDRIIVRQGFFTVKTQMIPIKRAQGVSFTSGPISRRFGLGHIEIKTAGFGIHLPPLKIDEARSLKTQIIELVKGETSDV